MASISETYTVFYHGGFSGRAQAADLLLVDAGASWKRGSKAELMEIDQSCFALPAVRNNVTGVVCGQTTAQVAFLGSELGYVIPAGQEFQALKIACDIADIWSEGYNARGGGDRDKCEEFMKVDNGRFLRFLTCINATRNNVAKALGADVKEWTFMLGATPSYLDFLMLNVKVSMDFAFGEEAVNACLNGIDGLKDTIANMAARPNIAAYLSAPDTEPVLYARIKGMPAAKVEV